MMNKRALYISLAVLAVGIAAFGWYKYEQWEEPKLKAGQIENEGQEAASDIKNIAYNFDGRPVKLENGTSVTWVAPDSAAQITTKYFGNETYVDLNNDGKRDVIFYVTQNQGGSGTFYYVVVALTTKDGYKGSEAYLVGDRVAPQPITVNEHGVIFVNYADRAIGQSFADAPSEGKTLRLKLDIDTMRFGIVSDGTGEADPTRMTLNMKTWVWQNTQLSDKTTVTPKQAGKFTIALTIDNKVTVGTDCNAISGVFTTEKRKLAFSKFVSTKMFCENAQEDVFMKELSSVTNFLFTSQGELKLTLKDRAGTMVFK